MLRINLSPSDIEAFLSVAETGSFSRSGKALGLSQPAISARIGTLEQRLGVPLFHRTTRRVAITHAGERLRVRVEHTMAELRGLLQELDDEAHFRRGRITLGASPTVAASVLAPIISRFHRERPEIDIILHDDFFGRALDRILRGEVDFAVVPFEPEDDQLVFERLFTDRFLLAVPSAHPLAGRGTVTLHDLAGETLITMPPHSAAWNTLKRAFTAAGLAFNPGFQIRNSLTELALVKAGFGVGLTTEILARTLTLDGVTLLQVDGADLSRHIGIARAPDRALSPAARAFCAILRDAAVAGG